MPGVSREGVDTAGGSILNASPPTVFVNGRGIIVLGDPVTPHGTSPHSSPVMSQSSATVSAYGILICRAGDSATCGHLATGSTDVFSS